MPTGKLGPGFGPEVWLGVPAVQLSVAVTVGHVTVAKHSPASLACVMFEGQDNTGFSLSVTVTVNEH